MANKGKTKDPRKQTQKPSKKSAAPVVQRVAAPTGITAATQIAIKIRASLPALPDAARVAFLAQTTPAERMKLGTRTKGDGVLRDAGEWIAQIAAARAKFGEGAVRYGAVRLAFLCEATLGLADALVSARGSRTGVIKAGSLRDAALATAHAVRDDLLHALKQVTRGHADAALVAEVERDLTHDDQLVAALGKLAELAGAWIQRAAKDEGVAALVAGAGLTAEDALRARAAAEALAGAGADRTAAGKGRPQDPAEVNAAEGTVLAEMRVARNAFDAAREKNPAIPRLVAGPATRDVLGTHGRAAKPPQASNPVAPQPASP